MWTICPVVGRSKSSVPHNDWSDADVVHSSSGCPQAGTIRQITAPKWTTLDFGGRPEGFASFWPVRCLGWHVVAAGRQGQEALPRGVSCPSEVERGASVGSLLSFVRRVPFAVGRVARLECLPSLSSAGSVL